MVLYGSFRDTQPIADFAIVEPLGGQAQDFQLRAGSFRLGAGPSTAGASLPFSRLTISAITRVATGGESTEPPAKVARICRYSLLLDGVSFKT